MAVIKHITYRELRDAVETVQDFVERKVAGRMTHLRMGMEDELQIAGLDTDELLEEFVQEFSISYEAFPWDDYWWNPESFTLGSINLRAVLLAPLKAVLGFIYGVSKMVALLTGRDAITNFPFASLFEGENPPPKVKAIFTGGDLVRSYVEKRMCTSKEIRYAFSTSI